MREWIGFLGVVFLGCCAAGWAEELVWKTRTVEDWTKVLQQSLEETRRPAMRDQWYAAYALGQYGASAKSAVPVLCKRLRKDWGEDDYVRAAVALSLGEIGDLRAVRSLVEELDSPYVAIQRNTALALGMLGETLKEKSPDGVPKLLTLLESSPDRTVRANAAVALWKIARHAAVLPFLEQELASAKTLDVYQGASVVIALASLWSEEEKKRWTPLLIPPLASRHPQEQDTARICMEALLSLGETAIPELEKSLVDAREKKYRSRLVFLLGKMDNQVARKDFLLSIVQGADTEEVRLAALRGLTSGCPERKEAIREAMVVLINNESTSAAMVHEATLVLKSLEE
ncbi:MAG: HEAT repeat domain-containing protein [Planctomycetia bacterium]|nr:HEAT repeat domain-containing protein [Planctomycetia bacterium]